MYNEDDMDIIEKRNIYFTLCRQDPALIFEHVLQIPFLWFTVKEREHAKELSWRIFGIWRYHYNRRRVLKTADGRSSDLRALEDKQK